MAISCIYMQIWRRGYNTCTSLAAIEPPSLNSALQKAARDPRRSFMPTITILNKALRTSYWIRLNSYVIFGSYRFLFCLTGRLQPATLKMPELQEYYYKSSSRTGTVVNCNVFGVWNFLFVPIFLMAKYVIWQWNKMQAKMRSTVACRVGGRDEVHL